MCGLLRVRETGRPQHRCQGVAVCQGRGCALGAGLWAGGVVMCQGHGCALGAGLWAGRWDRVGAGSLCRGVCK